jgi:hypothetical protein
MDLAAIAEKYDLKLLVVFGSHGTEHQTRSSDIDLGFSSSNLRHPPGMQTQGTFANNENSFWTGR